MGPVPYTPVNLRPDRPDLLTCHGPAGTFDLLVCDEAHRLKVRVTCSAQGLFAARTLNWVSNF